MCNNNPDENRFNTINEVANKIRTNINSISEDNQQGKLSVIHGHNGTGKTRLSLEFKNIGKNNNNRDTLYYNAFTEDLFTWDNDLEKDESRCLKFNKNSHFFDGIQNMYIEKLIRKRLENFTDIDFKIDYEENKIFFKKNINNIEIENIKISRGEERIFIFCFFLAILEVAIGDTNSVVDNNNYEGTYGWVRYVVIDDPMTSLDENNIVRLAAMLLELIKSSINLKFIITTHHILFFNLLYHGKITKIKDTMKKEEIKVRCEYYFLKFNDNKYILNGKNIPTFYHIDQLKMLNTAIKEDKIGQYHYNILRVLLEKTAMFLGHTHFSYCIRDKSLKEEGKMLLNISSHGGYSIYETGDNFKNKAIFKKIFNDFIEDYHFNTFNWRDK